MIAYPLQAATGGFLFGNIVIASRYHTNDTGYHGVDIGHTLVDISNRPPRSANINMCIMEIKTAGPDRNHREVTTAPKDGNPFRET